MNQQRGYRGRHRDRAHRKPAIGGKCVAGEKRANRVAAPHVHAENGVGEKRTAPYDRLLLATGSNPFILPVPGVELEGVLAYRDIADTQAMIGAATQYRKAVVIGGGLLGNLRIT